MTKLTLNRQLITHLKVENNYFWVHYPDGQRLLYCRPLRPFETVCADFIRIHKTALINPRFVDRWELPESKWFRAIIKRPR